MQYSKQQYRPTIFNNYTRTLQPKPYEIYWCDLPLDQSIPTQLGKKRPVVIISNEQHNKGAGSYNILPTTTSTKKDLPCHVVVDSLMRGDDERKTTILAEEIMTVPKEWIGDYITKLTWQEKRKVKEAILIQLGFM